MIRRVLLGFAFLLLSCSRGGPHRPLPGAAPAPANASGVGYDRVRAVFAKNCAACHPALAQPDWMNFDQARAYALSGRLVQRVVVERSMPPPQSAQASLITEDERQLIDRWAKAGAPQTARSTAQAPVVPEMPDVARACVQCHGMAGDGSASDPGIPAIAGQSEEYLAMQLEKFKWRERVDPSGRMNSVALGLSAALIKELAAHFAAMPLAPPKAAPDSRLLKEGSAVAENLCNACHMNPDTGGRPTDSTIPVLRGQSREYLFSQLLLFRSDPKRSEIMHSIAESLSREDIEAVTAYYSGIKP